VHWVLGGVRWLSDATYGWVYRAVGPDLAWQRLVNAVLHGCTGIALFAFFGRLFSVVLQEPRWRSFAFIGALAFVLHPVAVYAAGYLMQRSMLLATLFSVIALACALEGLLRRSLAWYAAAAIAYALALSSKEHAIMLPAVGLALAVLVRGVSRGALLRLAAWLAVCAVAAAFTIFARRELMGASYEPFAPAMLSRLGVEPRMALPLSMENQATLFFRYVATWLMPWPGWMSADIHTAFPTSLVGWPQTAGLAAWLAWAAAGVALLVRGGRAGLAGFAMLAPWLLGLTEFAVVRVQEPFVLYRSYLWMIGLPALAPLALAPLAPRWRTAAVALACLALAAGAHERLRTFGSAFALWDDAARKNTDPTAPLVERALYSRGLVHLDRGELEAARADFERAVELNPTSPDAHLTRGTYRLHSGKLADALADFDRALAIDPAYASAYNQRCVTRARMARFAAAIDDCRKAVELNPADDVAWNNTGALYRELGRRDEAAASYEKALALKPMNASAHYNYGMLLFDAGRRDTAVLGHFVLACQGGVADACDIVKRARIGKK
jgi:protein O-mannosyl-transferase